MSVDIAGTGWRRRFFVVWASQAVSLVGSSIAGFAIIWWLAKTTGSATVLAASALVSSLPFVLVGPLAGTLVDRVNRRLVMMGADGFVALVSAWLAYLFWTGQIRPWHVFVIMVARSLGSTFQWPAMQASTTLMVPARQ
jgi:DHA3 family macrolide efflux protein-like MFS transporter